MLCLVFEVRVDLDEMHNEKNENGAGKRKDFIL